MTDYPVIPPGIPPDASSSGRDIPVVLVVDDEWLNRELMQAVLESIGYQALLAGNAERGFKLAQEHLPNLVLVDVRLGYETEGYDLCRKLKTHPQTAQIKVAMLTAMDSEEDRRKAEAAGADGFISRMVETPDLIDQIDALLQKSEG